MASMPIFASSPQQRWQPWLLGNQGIDRVYKTWNDRIAIVLVVHSEVLHGWVSGGPLVELELV
jgi:hypothetical protein